MSTDGIEEEDEDCVSEFQTEVQSSMSSLYPGTGMSLTQPFGISKLSKYSQPPIRTVPTAMKTAKNPPLGKMSSSQTSLNHMNLNVSKSKVKRDLSTDKKSFLSASSEAWSFKSARKLARDQIRFSQPSSCKATPKKLLVSNCD